MAKENEEIIITLRMGFDSMIREIKAVNQRMDDHLSSQESKCRIAREDYNGLKKKVWSLAGIVAGICGYLGLNLKS